jgi:integrase/recombinase XerC
MNSKKFLSPDERSHLETTLRERMLIDTRNAVMILTALYSGARASELLALGWNDINISSGEIMLETLKHGRERAVVVPKFVRDGLKRLKDLSPERPFDLSYNRLGEIWRLYRPVNKPFHSLRHSFAMRVYDKTKDIRFTQRALGHRNIQNTMVYADYAYSAAEFKRIMRVR